MTRQTAGGVSSMLILGSTLLMLGGNGSHFPLFLGVFILGTTLLANPNAAEKPPWDEAEARREPMSAWPIVAAIVAMISVVVAAIALGVAHRLAFGTVPPNSVTLAVIWGASAGSALLTWAVLRRDAAGRLLRRFDRACSAAVAAWSDPTADDAKPKPKPTADPDMD